MKKSGRFLQHGRVGAHAAARLVDAPALPGGVARPDERHRAAVGRRGAEAADHRLAQDGRRGEVGKADAVEDVLPGRQTFEQRLGGEIALRQRIDEHAAVDGLEAVGGRHLDRHARRPVGARPDHAGISRHVARLNAMGDHRPVGGAAQIGPRDAIEAGRHAAEPSVASSRRRFKIRVVMATSAFRVELTMRPRAPDIMPIDPTTVHVTCGEPSRHRSEKRIGTDQIDRLLRHRRRKRRQRLGALRPSPAPPRRARQTPELRAMLRASTRPLRSTLKLSVTTPCSRRASALAG